MSIFSSEDMIFNKKNGQVTAGGWNINSELLQNDFPLSASAQSGGGRKGGGSLENLAVPAGCSQRPFQKILNFLIGFWIASGTDFGWFWEVF